MHQNKNPQQSPWQRRRQQRRQQDEQLAAERKQQDDQLAAERKQHDDQLATERKQALDASAPRLRNLFIFVQVFLLYVVVSIFGVDDRDLLDPNSTVKVPLLNIGLTNLLLLPASASASCLASHQPTPPPPSLPRQTPPLARRRPQSATGSTSAQLLRHSLPSPRPMAAPASARLALVPALLLATSGALLGTILVRRLPESLGNLRALCLIDNRLQRQRLLLLAPRSCPSRIKSFTVMGVNLATRVRYPHWRLSCSVILDFWSPKSSAHAGIHNPADNRRWYRRAFTVVKNLWWQQITKSFPLAARLVTQCSAFSRHLPYCTGNFTNLGKL